MKITTLLENTTCRSGVGCEHGLSQLIETREHTILFDTGASGLFAENARALGKDLRRVELLFLSHAHNDHGGGIAAFCRANGSAPIFLSREAWGRYFVVTPQKKAYIGLDDALHEQETRLRYLSGVTERRFWSGANDTLREEKDGAYPCDPFRHEQNLIVTEDGVSVLFAGCAHCGIVNILRRAEEILGRAPDFVLGGFHLFNPSLGTSEPRERVESIARELAAREHTRYYTGHCTGTEAFALLRETLGERIQPMPAGSELTLG